MLKEKNSHDLICGIEKFGHWEIDTVLENVETSSAFLTIDERKSRKRHIIKIKAKTTENVAEGISKLKMCVVKISQKHLNLLQVIMTVNSKI